MQKLEQFEPFPEWKWSVPKHFNIGAACTDKHLNTPAASMIAMIVEDDAQGTSQITFEQLAKRTDQFAQLLRNLKIKLLYQNQIILILYNN